MHARFLLIEALASFIVSSRLVDTIIPRYFTLSLQVIPSTTSSAEGQFSSGNLRISLFYPYILSPHLDYNPLNSLINDAASNAEAVWIIRSSAYARRSPLLMSYERRLEDCRAQSKYTLKRSGTNTLP